MSDRNEGDECKLCGKVTENIFNIGFKGVPVCEGCANSIMLQQATWLVQNQHLS